MWLKLIITSYRSRIYYEPDNPVLIRNKETNTHIVGNDLNTGYKTYSDLKLCTKSSAYSDKNRVKKNQSTFGTSVQTKYYRFNHPE